MRLLDSLTIQQGSETHTIALYEGDLSQIPVDERVDILVVSAFPDDYFPVRRSLIGALYQRGISVASLAKYKQTDLRHLSSCWLSREIPHTPNEDPGFVRLLCFEPQSPDRAAAVVGDIFRSLIALITEPTAVAMPLVAAGAMGVSVDEMLPVLVEAAANWMALGLKVTKLKIVERDPLKAQEMLRLFQSLKAKYAAPAASQAKHPFKYDVFISYCQKNSATVDLFIAELRDAHPGIRIFMDRLELNPSVAWQHAIYQALDDCARIVTFYSPEYLNSDICIEEVNIALLRQRLTRTEILYPIYLYSTNLPTYLLARHYVDCLEGDPIKLQSAARDLARRIAES